MAVRGGKREGAGRKKGTLNKENTDLKIMIHCALTQVGGQDYLAQQAIENPSAFMTLVGKILPRDVNVGGQQDNPIKITKIELIDL